MNVYDFDKTIYKKDSSVQFYLYVIIRKPIVFFKCIWGQLRAILLYKAGKIEKEQMKEKYFSFLSYINVEDMVSRFVEKELKNINKWYLTKKKEDDVIISASPEFLVKAFANRLGIKNVIASDVDFQTGVYRGKNCYGAEKERRFQSVYGDMEINEFYTDSYSDLPLAKRAKKAFRVKNKRIQNF